MRALRWIAHDSHQSGSSICSEATRVLVGVGAHGGIRALSGLQFLDDFFETPPRHGACHFSRQHPRPDAAEHAARAQRDLILLLPDLTVLLIRLLRDGRVPAGGKAIALFGVGYLLSPIDLIPGLLFGPIGLIDDLLVLSACFSRLLNYVHPDVVESNWPGQGDALDAIQRLAEWSENLLTNRLPAVVRRIFS